MPSKSVECSLNTTECILKTVVSILSEIQDENNQYNWDPLSFAATAVVGVIALFFAALTIGQSFLAAGPGRTKSGAYAIGPWSRLNDGKFDWIEMRYRTVSRTPVLLAKAILEPSWDQLNSLRHQRIHHVPLPKELVALEDPKYLKKRHDDYFPATWLALLTAMNLDETKLWGSKSTGADYIPSDLSIVPAYSSIRFIVTLAIIFARGYARLIIDPESKLPRVQGTGFNLTFRQHPLLGAVGVFERYEAELSPTSQGLDEVKWLILYGNGYMEVPMFETEEAINQRESIMVTYARELDWNYVHFELSMMFLKRAEAECVCNVQKAPPSQRCCGLLPSSWPSSCELLRQLLDQNLINFNIARWGPLYPLIADRPCFLPLLFPRTKARFRDKLDTLFLHSRFWAMKTSAYLELSPDQPGDFSRDQRYLLAQATSWATTVTNDPVTELELSPTAWALTSDYLARPLSAVDGDRLEEVAAKTALEFEIVAIDAWLKQAGPLVLCRQMTLGILGHAIQEVMLNANPGTAESTIGRDQFMFLELHEKLERFLHAVRDPDLKACLFHGVFPGDTAGFDRAKEGVCKLLDKIRDLWETEEVQENVDDDEEEDEPRLRPVWKLPNTSQHPLDDLLIYRAVLVSLLYSLSIDSSNLLEEESYGLVVPIM
ncbi:uncharacterized protein NECHADRAFT_78014 [Fusarium vanettenii 77-13-4]|uniref:Uncharacterized protein n=1 Tax=Fusarium vanettenii (strain ATCC MYA-4622 / CBS 123669 / FGSC 9596 / NRRL 45880 / 77-13-4) TaxID=660122 RepID=C7YMV8_FUSV7|nr:uncharacterized protein NECHADRAFT_78014 [Fusarium vanettenii 77-13-4]EEU47514.1 predicted protein [Fusarium vanettenii 77-13-4]